MKTFFIITVLIVILILLIGAVFFIFNIVKKTSAVSASQIDVSTSVAGAFRAFSFNNSYKNDMDEGLGDSRYYYLSSGKVVLELWGYNSDDVIDKETSISPEEFEKLQQDILSWIEKYDIEALAKNEADATQQDEEFATDTHSSFSITIYYRNADDVVLTAFPDKYTEMLSDLDEIFSDYK